MSRVLEVVALDPAHPKWNAPCCLEVLCQARARYLVQVRRGAGVRREAACARHTRELAHRDRIAVPEGAVS